MGIRQLVRDGEADTAAAAAKIQHARCFPAAQNIKRKVGDSHGVVARDEHIRRDLQRDPIEIPLSENIRQRLVRQHAVYITTQFFFDLLACI